MRLDYRINVAAVAALSLALPIAASAAVGPNNLPVYEAASASPHVDHVIRRVHVRECSGVATEAELSEARSRAIAHLSHRASSVGANGLVRVEVKVVKSNMLVVSKVIPNPCLFETDAAGDAAVLGG